jgi:hypothetical protein
VEWLLLQGQWRRNPGRSSAQFPTLWLADPLIRNLSATLHRYNRLYHETARIQLRAAFAFSPTTTAYPASRSSICFRLLQSAALKHALAKHNADIAFIASEYVYQEILQYEYDNAVYEPVDVQMKETITRAWLRVFGTAAAQREALNGRNCWPSAN